ncbi:hypothetical protein H4S04_009110, partial [Coemansia sp. S16]
PMSLATLFHVATRYRRSRFLKSEIMWRHLNRCARYLWTLLHVSLPKNGGLAAGGTFS